MDRVQVFVGLAVCWSWATSAAAQTRVACVGDSITEGYGLGSPQADAYPAQLQGLLGNGYDVENFGVSGSTARKQGDKPYWTQGAYTQSTNFDADLVLLMLGTNDAKPSNWDEAAFRADYADLVAHYADLGARVFVATPPKVFGNGAFEISPTTVSDTLVPLVRDLAAGTGAMLVDVFAATAEHAAWFPDNVHPSREGAQLIAETFAAAVTAALESETSETSATTSDSMHDASTVAPTASPAPDASSAPSQPTTGEPDATLTPTAAPTAAPTVTPSRPAVPEAPTSATVSGTVSPAASATATDSNSSVAPSGSTGLTPTTSDAAGGNAPPATPRDGSSCHVMRVGSPGTWATLLAAALALVVRRGGGTRANAPR